MRIAPVILAGGSGTRLWPLSHESLPKQFLALTESRTLLQATALRTAGQPDFCDPIVVANMEHRFRAADQLLEVGVRARSLVVEPFGRNTGPAATVAAMILADSDPDALMLLMPSDHVIGNPDAFLSAIWTGAEAARDGNFVLFGTKPSYAATAYGYIEIGERLADNVHRVRRFVEKPAPAAAEQFVATGRFFWNSGIFLLPVRAFLAEIQRLAPDVASAARTAFESAVVDADFTRLDADAFGAAPSTSIDHAVFEKTERAVVIPVEMGWQDIGSWSSIWQAAGKDDAGNVLVGNVVADRTSNSYLRTDGPRLAVLGVDDMVVVATSDAVLVVRLDCDQDIRRVADLFTEKPVKR